ncbi:MAG: hypothetical protein Q9P01_07510, partial [Anaerolineae bacterium]|nr:hypothetical protein [Anaerolineae bacterium]
ILGIEINDTGASGSDTVAFAMESAALTIEALSDTRYTASDGTNTVFLQGIENIETGAANDIFVLGYDANGVNNRYDAGENDFGTDRDTAIIETDLDLNLVFAGNAVTVNATDTLLNFETFITGNGDDSFVMRDDIIGGFDLDGGLGVNSVLYDTANDLLVTLAAADSLTVTDGLLTDTLTNISNVTTGDGDDSFDLDINAASTTTAYNFNGGGGNNIFRFFFDGETPLTDTVNMTVSADGDNNILDFSGVNVAVTIDLASRSPQEVFDNFMLTVQGVFEAILPDAPNLPTDLPPEIATEANPAQSNPEQTTVTATPSDVPVETTAEATPQPSTEPVATEATPQPTTEPVATEATPQPPVESTPAPETTAES